MEKVQVETEALPESRGCWRTAVFLHLMAILIMAVVVFGGCDRDRRSSADAKRGTNQPVVSTPPAQTPAPPPPSEVAAVAPAQPSEPTPVTYSEAEAAYFSGRYADASRLFAGYATAHPQNAMGHYMFGLSLWKAGTPKESEAAFRRALELNPGHVKSHVNLARVLLEDGRAEEALAAAKQAVELEPENKDALRVRGRAFHNLKMANDAIESYELAIAIDPDDAWTLNNLGLVLIEEGRPGDAIAPLARATRLAGGIALFQNNLGIALEQSGHYRAAGEAYAQALAADASYAKAAVNRARVEGLRERADLPEIDLAGLADAFPLRIKGEAGAEQ